MKVRKRGRYDQKQTNQLEVIETLLPEATIARGRDRIAITTSVVGSVSLLVASCAAGEAGWVFGWPV